MQREIISKIFQVMQGKLCKVSCQMEDRWLITIGHEITQSFHFVLILFLLFMFLLCNFSDKLKSLKSNIMEKITHPGLCLIGKVHHNSPLIHRG